MPLKNNKRKLVNVLIIFVLALALIVCSYKFLYAKSESPTQNQVSADQYSQETAATNNNQTSPDARTEPEKPEPVAASESYIPILMYHHVKTNTDPNNKVEVALDVPADIFDAEMKYLADNNFKTIKMANLFQADQGKKIVLTFDDGYDDIILSAYPIMEKYGFIGVAFVMPDFIGKSGYMSWANINKLKSAGWEIGSHTLSHPDLTKYAEDVVRSQVTKSKQTIEENIGETVTSFCYPSGKYNQLTLDMVKEAKYTLAVTTNNGYHNFLSSPLELKRVRVLGDEGVRSFKNKIPLDD